MPDTTASTATPTEQAQAFNISIRNCFYLDAFDFRRGTQAVYGRGIEIIDSPNDTTHEYSDVGKAEPILFEQEKLDQAIADGYIEADHAEIVLWDLVQKGVLSPGDYFIRVSW